MGQRTYTKPVQFALFESLKRHAGKWNAEWKSGRRGNTSQKEWEQICNNVHADLKKQFKETAPKTVRSVDMAIWFTLELAGSKPQQPQFRLSAYEAGFFTMNDILELERRAGAGEKEEPPVIYQEIKSPVRKVFYVDIGDLPLAEVKAALESIRQRTQK